MAMGSRVGHGLRLCLLVSAARWIGHDRLRGSDLACPALDELGACRSFEAFHFGRDFRGIRSRECPPIGWYFDFRGSA